MSVMLTMVVWLCIVQSVEGMKLICYELMDAANREPSDHMLQLYDASANELVIELTWKVEQVGIPCTHARALLRPECIDISDHHPANE
jgi:hypothetical protein